MEIILLQDVDKVGDKFDIVTVKNGYGRNYLIPQGLALIANNTNRRRLEDFKRREASAREKMLDQFEAMAEKIKEANLRIGAKAGTSGKIFGSVTSIQLSNAIKEQLSMDVERKLIEINDEVKEIGSYTATVNFHPKVQPQLKFEVVAE